MLADELDAIFTFSYLDAALAFRLAMAVLGALDLRLSLYTLRHGGASTDVAYRLRSMLEVQRRGGWETETSVRRYEKHARLARVAWRVPVFVRDQEQATDDELRRRWAMPSTWQNERQTSVRARSFWTYTPARHRWAAGLPAKGTARSP